MMGLIYDGCCFVRDDYHSNSTFIIYFFSQVVIVFAPLLFTSLVVQVPQNLVQAASLRNIPRWIPEYVNIFFVPALRLFLFFFCWVQCILGASLLCFYRPWILLQFCSSLAIPSLHPSRRIYSPVLDCLVTIRSPNPKPQSSIPQQTLLQSLTKLSPFLTLPMDTACSTHLQR